MNVVLTPLDPPGRTLLFSGIARVRLVDGVLWLFYLNETTPSERYPLMALRAVDIDSLGGIWW